MNQEYRERVKRHLESGGDPKYVNVKKKAEARHSEAKSKALEAKKGKKMKEGVNKIGNGKVHSRMSHLFGMDK